MTDRSKESKNILTWQTAVLNVAYISPGLLTNLIAAIKPQMLVHQTLSQLMQMQCSDCLALLRWTLASQRPTTIDTKPDTDCH